MSIFRYLSRAAGALAIAGLLLFAPPQAQAHPGGPGGSHCLEQLSQRLQLSPEQQTQIKALFEERFAAQQEKRRVKIEQAPRDDAFRQKMEAERAALNDQIKAVLTPEQQAEWENVQAEFKNPGESRADGPTPHGSPAEFFAQRLQLTPEQQSRIAAIYEERFAARKAERAARQAQLTPEQKAERQARRQERAAAMQAERAALESEIKALLTPEQRAEFEKMKSERKDCQGAEHDKRPHN